MIVASDTCGTPSVVLTSVASSEADDGGGDGDTPDDIQGAEPGTEDYRFELRAERAAAGQARVYTALYTATDEAGNTSSASGYALVPHDRGPMVDPRAGAVRKSDEANAVCRQRVVGRGIVSLSVD
jgi:hypothetical protein